MAIAELKESYLVSEFSEGFVILNNGNVRTHIEAFYKELSFGFYEEGRHAWELSNVKAIEPIAAKGQQGWWNWEGAK